MKWREIREMLNKVLKDEEQVGFIDINTFFLEPNHLNRMLNDSGELLGITS